MVSLSWKIGWLFGFRGVLVVRLVSGCMFWTLWSVYRINKRASAEFTSIYLTKPQERGLYLTSDLNKGAVIVEQFSLKACQIRVLTYRWDG